MAPTPLYLNGFENQVFAIGGNSTDTIWQSIGIPANVTISSEGTIKRGAGSRSMKIAVAGGGANSQASMQASIASQTMVAYRFYFRKSGDPSQTNSFIGLVSPAASTFFTLTHQTDGTLQMRASGGTSPTNGGSSAALSNDTWYLIDVTVDTSTTAYVARLFVDGTQVSGDATITGAAAGSMTRVNIGKVQGGTNTTAFDLYFDDFIIGTPADLTDTFGATDGIVGLVPDGDGTHNPSPPTAGHFQDASSVDISGGNPAWDNLDSGDLTQTAEYISQPTAGSTEYLEVTFGTTTLSASAPVAVQAEVGLNTDGTNAFSASTRIENGGTETVVFTGDWSTAAGTEWWKRKLITVADQTELDGLKARIGYGSSQPATPRWTALMLEVDIGAASSSPQTVNASGLASAQSFGSIQADIAFAVSGLDSVGSFGSPSALPGNVNVGQTGLGSAGAFGSVATATGNVNVSMSALASAGAFGTPSASGGALNVPVTGLDSAGSFGSASGVPGNVDEGATGLDSAQQFGTPSIATGGTIVGIPGLGSAQLFGVLTIDGGEAPTFNPAVHGGKFHHT